MLTATPRPLASLWYDDDIAVAGATGFEPATSGLTGRHANRYTTPPWGNHDMWREGYHCGGRMSNELGNGTGQSHLNL